MGEKYEASLRQHLVCVEEEVARETILLETKYKILLAEKQGVTRERQKLLSDIQRLSADIGPPDHLENEESDLDLHSLADLLSQIMEKSIKELNHKEKKLRLELATLKQRKPMEYQSSERETTLPQLERIFVKLTAEIDALKREKMLQDAYLDRLRTDIIFGEKRLSNLALTLRDLKLHQPKPFLFYPELKAELQKLFSVDTKGEDAWTACIKFAVEEESLSTVAEESSFDAERDSQTADMQQMLKMSCQNFVLENLIEMQRKKLQQITEIIETQKEATERLRERFILAKMRFRCHSSQLSSHADPVQEAGFVNEIKVELRKLLCDKLSVCLSLFDSPEPPTGDLAQHLSLINVAIFPPDLRSQELLVAFRNRRKKLVAAERRRAASSFRIARLIKQNETQEQLVEDVRSKRREVERHLVAIGLDPFSPEQEKDDVIVDEVCESWCTKRRKEMKTEIERSLHETILEKQNYENEMLLLQRELDDTTETSKQLQAKINKLQQNSKYEDSFNIMNEITAVQADSHKKALQIYDIQKELESILSRRNCHLVARKAAASSVATGAQDQSSLVVSLTAEVSDLRLAVQAARTAARNVLLS